MKHLKNLSVLITVIASIGFMACSTGSATPSGTVEKYYDLVKNKDFESATKMLVTHDGEKFSEEEAKKVEGLLGTMAQDQIEKKEGIKNITIEEEKIDEDGNWASVFYTIEYGNGDTDKEDGRLFKIDGKWFLKVS